MYRLTLAEHPGVDVQPMDSQWATTVHLEGKDYEFKWDRASVLYGDREVGWIPHVDTGSVWDHERNVELTWEEFQEETLWFYDAARVAALIYSRQTDDWYYDPRQPE